MIGSGSADAPGRPELVRDTLHRGALLLRRAALPAPLVEPVAADLRIGAIQGEPHEVFADVCAIGADDDGTIHVLDRLRDTGARRFRVTP